MTDAQKKLLEIEKNHRDNTPTDAARFFAAEQNSGTLRGAVLSNPSAAVRELGPLETIRIGCGAAIAQATR
jgi:hypothetical protein